MPERDRYQWEDRAFPLWHDLVKLADEVGVEKYALENFSAMLVWNPETLFRLRDEVGPKVGMNLDPSHLFWKGADPIAGARALGDAIHHCHGKDTRIERGLADVNGLLELREVTDVANRTWNYVAVGAGHDLQWWKEFFSVVRMVGYNGWVSLEMEDFTMSTEAGNPVVHRRASGHDQPLKPDHLAMGSALSDTEGAGAFSKRRSSCACAPCCWGMSTT